MLRSFRIKYITYHNESLTKRNRIEKIAKSSIQNFPLLSLLYGDILVLTHTNMKNLMFPLLFFAYSTPFFHTQALSLIRVVLSVLYDILLTS